MRLGNMWHGTHRTLSPSAKPALASPNSPRMPWVPWVPVPKKCCPGTARVAWRSSALAGWTLTTFLKPSTPNSCSPKLAKARCFLPFARTSGRPARFFDAKTGWGPFQVQHAVALAQTLGLPELREVGVARRGVPQAHSERDALWLCPRQERQLGYRVPGQGRSKADRCGRGRRRSTTGCMCVRSLSMFGMNRLPLELCRLYGLGPNATDASVADVDDAALQRGIRAMVLEVALPAGWEQLSPVWRGVQSDLDLPAPAIAVSGVDGLQLWFSCASRIPPPACARFLHALHRRYLPSLAPTQVRVFVEAAALPATPPVQISSQRWSAFVTSDLASVFDGTPWLDIAPGDEGQATILRALEPIRQVAFEAALNRLGAIEGDSHPEPIAANRPAAGAARSSEPGDTDPARFLTSVMNDKTAPLALRVEAGKALLRYARRS